MVCFSGMAGALSSQEETLHSGLIPLCRRASPLFSCMHVCMCVQGREATPSSASGVAMGFSHGQSESQFISYYRQLWDLDLANQHIPLCGQNGRSRDGQMPVLTP